MPAASTSLKSSTDNPEIPPKTTPLSELAAFGWIPCMTTNSCFQNPLHWWRSRCPPPPHPRLQIHSGYGVLCAWTDSLVVAPYRFAISDEKKSLFRTPGDDQFHKLLLWRFQKILVPTYHQPPPHITLQHIYGLIWQPSFLGFSAKNYVLKSEFIFA